MNKFLILALTLFLFSCASKTEMEQKARHQSETGARINDAQKDTDSLFQEMK
jgi:hypothetical protein